VRVTLYRASDRRGNIRRRIELFAVVIIAVLVSITAAYAQDPTKITKILSCEYDFNPDTGSYDSLLCSNPEMDLCIMRTDLTDVGGGMVWQIMNPMLCEAE
jgi:hypothetical protein